MLGSFLGGRGVAGAHLIPAAAHPQARRLPHRRHVVVHLVHGQALLDVGCEVARGTPEGAVAVVILAVPVQVPFVRGAEVAHVALDHRHRVVLDVLGVSGLDVRDVGALGAPEELGLDVLLALVSRQLRLATAREVTHGALEHGGGLLGLVLALVRSRGRLVLRGWPLPRFAAWLHAVAGAVHHLRVAEQLLEVAGRVQAAGALVDPYLLAVHIAEVVEVDARVLREEVAVGAGARVVSLHFAVGQLLAGGVAGVVVWRGVALLVVAVLGVDAGRRTEQRVAAYQAAHYQGVSRSMYHRRH